MATSETTSVPEATVKAALAAVEGHPLQREAVSWAHCPNDVFSIQKTFVERTRIPEEEKAKLRTALDNVESVLVVSYWASSKKPEPLAGGGEALCISSPSRITRSSSRRCWHLEIMKTGMQAEAPNPSIEGDVQGLSPSAAPHVKR